MGVIVDKAHYKFVLLLNELNKHYAMKTHGVWMYRSMFS
jgi:hypothetical protein